MLQLLLQDHSAQGRPCHGVRVLAGLIHCSWKRLGHSGAGDVSFPNGSPMASGVGRKEEPLSPWS